VADGGARKGAEEKKQPSGADPDPMVDVYSAVLDHLRRFVEREGSVGSLSALYIIEVRFLLLAGLGTGRCFRVCLFGQLLLKSSCSW
jgi:hypothetical protein